MKGPNVVPHVRIARRAAIWLACALASAGMLTGCGLLAGLPGHARYDITLENHSSAPVVFALLDEDWPVRACAVQRVYAAGTNLCAPVKVEVRDEKGEALANWSITDCATKQKAGWCELRIRYPATESNACPVDNRSEYLLVLHNAQQQDLDVWANDAHLGPLPARETVRFGPLRGDWAMEPKLELRDANGQVLEDGPDYQVSTEDVDYDLGQTPVLEWWIGKGWGR